MSLIRRAKRRDMTERAIIDGLRQLGFQVRQQDFPDLLVRRRSTGQVFLLEVEGVTKNRKREQTQLDFIQSWGIPIVRDLEAALIAMNVEHA